MSGDDTETPREKASKIPSWIMVGFVLGALSFYTLNDYLKQPDKNAAKETAQPAPAASSAAQAQQTPQTPSPAPAVQPIDTKTTASPLLDRSSEISLFAIDAIFRQWKVNAMWDYGSTQVVFWNPADKKYSITVEVFRFGRDESDYEYFYRLIDKATRPVIHEGTRSDAPILFTENEEATKRREEKERQRWMWR